MFNFRAERLAKDDTRPVFDSLSKREQEVVRLLVTGLSNKDISRRLRISAATVKIHLHNSYRKLRVSSRAELVARSAVIADLDVAPSRADIEPAAAPLKRRNR
jgi:DNA-binding NarL/FixJ family response regulator